MGGDRGEQERRSHHGELTPPAGRARAEVESPNSGTSSSSSSTISIISSKSLTVACTMSKQEQDGQEPSVEWQRENIVDLREEEEEQQQQQQQFRSTIQLCRSPIGRADSSPVQVAPYGHLSAATASALSFSRHNHHNQQRQQHQSRSFASSFRCNYSGSIGASSRSPPIQALQVSQNASRTASSRMQQEQVVARQQASAPSGGLSFGARARQRHSFHWLQGGSKAAGARRTSAATTAAAASPSGNCPMSPAINCSLTNSTTKMICGGASQEGAAASKLDEQSHWPAARSMSSQLSTEQSFSSRRLAHPLRLQLIATSWYGSHSLLVASLPAG